MPMTPEASPPQPVDWVFALFRGLHPLRCLLCLAGVLLTGLSLAVAQSCLDPDAPPVLAWWQHPVANTTALGAALWGSLARTVLVGGLLLAGNGALWCLIGGWIARHELARRWRAAGADDEPLRPGPTAFLVGWSKTLVWCVPSVLIVMFVGLVILLLAGWVNGWFGGLGSILVALFLPVVLLGTAMVLLSGAGVVAWPLMPVTVAAECSDAFNPWARAPSYLLQCPLRYLLLSAVALGLAWLPWGAAVHLLAPPLMAGHPEARPVVCLVAAALCASVFWSLETLVYLHLRTAVDGVDAGEVAGPARLPRPRGEALARNASRVATAAPAGARRGMRGILLFLAYLAGSWCLTSYLLMRVGGPTDWLDGGLLPWSVPPAQDVGFPYLLARILAGLWGLGFVVCLGAMVRRVLSGAPSRTPGDLAILELFRQIRAGEALPADTCPRLVEYLGHPDFWVRWQAHRFLVRLVPAGKGFGYRAWGPAKQRDAAVAKWRELISPREPAGTPEDQAGGERPREGDG